MGLWDKIKKAASSVANFVSDVVETVVDVVSVTITAVETAVETFIDDTVDTVKEWFKKETKKGRDDNTLKMEEKYATMATKYRNEMEPKCSKLEEEFIKLYRANFTMLEINDSPLSEVTKKKINDCYIEGEMKLKNTMIDYLNKNVTKDNVTFCDIIKEHDSTIREVKMSDYLSDVKSGAVDCFAKRVQDEVTTQNKFIEEILNEEFDNIESRAVKSIKEFEKIRSIDGKDLESKQNELIKYGVILSQCDHILEKCK